MMGESTPRAQLSPCNPKPRARVLGPEPIVAVPPVPSWGQGGQSAPRQRLPVVAAGAEGDPCRSGALGGAHPAQMSGLKVSRVRRPMPRTRRNASTERKAPSRLRLATIRAASLGPMRGSMRSASIPARSISSLRPSIKRRPAPRRSTRQRCLTERRSRSPACKGVSRRIDAGTLPEINACNGCGAEEKQRTSGGPLSCCSPMGTGQRGPVESASSRWRAKLRIRPQRPMMSTSRKRWVRVTAAVIAQRPLRFPHSVVLCSIHSR